MKVLTMAEALRKKPLAQRFEVRDGGAQGLYLVIQPGGAKSWALRFRRPNGSPGKLTLGPLDLAREMPDEPVIGAPLTLAGARQLAAKVHRQRQLGRDVIGEHTAAKHRRRVEAKDYAENTFGHAVRYFIDNHARLKTRRWRETAKVLGLRYSKTGDGEPEETKGGLTAIWGSRPLAEITSDDITAIIDDSQEHGIPGLKARTKGVSDARGRKMGRALGGMFGWLNSTKNRNRKYKLAANPCLGVSVPAAPEERERVLDDAEIVAFWHACDKIGEPFGAALKLLLLTGQRLREVTGMRRSELSGNGETWSLTAERTKNRKPHLVPLPPLARELIASVKRIEGDFVFTTTGKSPVSIGSKIKNRLDAVTKLTKPWRLHDLRRTFVTGMNELGIERDVVELVVNHKSGTRAGVAGIYNRSERLSERKAALERWALHVAGLVGGRPANVVPLKAKRGGRSK
jgi:integrase